MIVLTESNFLTEARNHQLLLVEFRSELCPPCIRMDTIMEGLEQKIKGGRIAFATIDIDEYPILEEQFQVESTPTIMLIADSKIIGRHEGHLYENQLRKFISQSIKGYQNRQAQTQ